MVLGKQGAMIGEGRGREGGEGKVHLARCFACGSVDGDNGGTERRLVGEEV